MRRLPFPSFGDGDYLTVYPALMAGLLMLVRRRNPERDRAPHRLGDHDARPGAAVVGRADRAVHHDDDADAAAKLVSSPIRSATSCCWRRVRLPRHRPAPAGLLPAELSIVALLVTDFAYGVLTLNSAYHDQVARPRLDRFYLLLWGAAALHPSMVKLQEPDPRARGHA